MPRFTFEARADDGQMRSGHREAQSASALAAELAESGMIPLRVVAAEDERTQGPALGRWAGFRRKVTANELVMFSHQMHSLTRAGISVDRAARGLAESQKNERFAEVVHEVAANLETGSDLATSLRRFPDVFSELYASIIHVGENTGRLDQAFKQIAGYLQVEQETRKRIRTATRYPMFVLVTIGIAIVILNVFVIPTFAQVFDKFHAELPIQTRLIVAISDFFVDYWLALLATAAGVVVWVRRYVSTDEGRYAWDRWKLKLPIVGSIYERIHLARFCQTFAMCSRAGIPITQALQIIARAIGNEFMAERVSQMRAGIERGETIIQNARDTGMFTPVVLQMIAVGEETGTMDELLEQAAGFYDEEVDYELRSLTDKIEPVLVIGIGVMVLILALGVFLPLWDLSAVATR